MSDVNVCYYAQFKASGKPKCLTESNQQWTNGTNLLRKNASRWLIWGKGHSKKNKKTSGFYSKARLLLRVQKLPRCTISLTAFLHLCGLVRTFCGGVNINQLTGGPRRCRRITVQFYRNSNRSWNDTLYLFFFLFTRNRLPQSQSAVDGAYVIRRWAVIPFGMARRRNVSFIFNMSLSVVAVLRNVFVLPQIVKISA